MDLEIFHSGGVAVVRPALHRRRQVGLLRRQRRVVLSREQHVVEHCACPDARHGGARALLVTEASDGAPSLQAPDRAPRLAAHCVVRGVELRLRRAGHRWPPERHHEPGEKRVPVAVTGEVLAVVEHLPLLQLLVQGRELEHLEIGAVAAEPGGEGEDAGGGAGHELRGEGPVRAVEARAGERAAAGRERGGRGGAARLGGEREPESEVREEHAAEAARGGARRRCGHPEEGRERRVGQPRGEAREREREERRGRERRVGKERVEEAREEVEGGRRHPERERVVVRARRRQRQRLRLRLQRGRRNGVQFLDVEAPALAGRGGGGVEEDEERGGGGGEVVGEEEEEEGGGGRRRHRRRPRRMVVVVVALSMYRKYGRRFCCGGLEGRRSQQ